jgi:hypothetical protein
MDQCAGRPAIYLCVADRTETRAHMPRVVGMALLTAVDRIEPSW